VEVAGPELAAASEAPSPPEGRTSPGNSLVPVTALIKDGLLHVGDWLRFKRRFNLKDVERRVRVGEKGIEVDGEHYDAPSSAAKAILGGQVDRGWDRFRVDMPGTNRHDKWLIELRAQYLAKASEKMEEAGYSPELRRYTVAVLKQHLPCFFVIEQASEGEFSLPEGLGQGKAESDKPTCMKWSDDPKQHPISHWKDALVAGTERALSLLKLPPDKLPMDYSSDPSDLRYPREVGQGLYIATHASAEVMREWLSEVLRELKKPEGYLQITTASGMTHKLPPES
jgi:hypothetical protein